MHASVLVTAMTALGQAPHIEIGALLTEPTRGGGLVKVLARGLENREPKRCFVRVVGMLISGRRAFEVELLEERAPGVPQHVFFPGDLVPLQELITLPAHLLTPPLELAVRAAAGGVADGPGRCLLPGGRLLTEEGLAEAAACSEEVGRRAWSEDTEHRLDHRSVGLECMLEASSGCVGERCVKAVIRTLRLLDLSYDGPWATPGAVGSKEL